MSEKGFFLCPHCQIGHLRAQTAPYVTVEDDLFLSVPDAKLWSCDICGYQEFDDAVLLQVEQLIGQSRATGQAQRKNSYAASEAPESNPPSVKP